MGDPLSSTNTPIAARRQAIPERRGLRAVAPARRVAGLALTAVVGTGCVSDGRLTAEPLPFHVAVVPFTARPSEPRSYVTAEPGSTEYFDQVEEQFFGPQREVGLQLDFDGNVVSTVFAETLDSLSFAQVTLLPFPAGVGADAFRELPVQSQQDHWLERAEAIRADLLLTAELAYAPDVEAERNGYFWLGLALFSLGGPAVWFVEDQEYVVEAHLQAALYDLNPMLGRDPTATITNRRSQLMELHLWRSRVTASFLERAGSGLQLASFLVPAGLLPDDDSVLHRHLNAEIVVDLLTQFVQEVQNRQTELLSAERLFAFRPEDLAVVDAGDGRRQLRGEIVLRTDATDLMDSYRVWTEGVASPIEASFPWPELESDRLHRRYPIRVDLPPTEDETSVRLEATDGAPKPSSRSFTLTGKQRASKPIKDIYLRVAELSAEGEP